MTATLEPLSMASSAPARSPSLSDDRYSLIFTASKRKGNRIPAPLGTLLGGGSPCRGASLRQGIFDPTGLFCGFHVREYRHSGSFVGSGFEGHGAVDHGKNRMVDADAYARAGVPLGAAL